MMDESRFWGLIDASRESAKTRPRRPNEEINGVQEEALAESLERLSPEELIAFNERFWEANARAYRWDLWAVAYWMEGGCSDDAFTDFRSCLVSLGRKLFTRALENPDSLADLIGLPDTPYLQAEGFQYVALKVYRKKTGEEMPQGESGYAPDEPAGEPIEMEDEEVMRGHFPRLLEKMPEMGS